MSSRTSGGALAVAVACALLPSSVAAQTIGYGSSDSDSAAAPANAPADAPRHRHANPRIKVTPYVEASQVVTADLSPGSDVLTYTSLAAGVDAQVNGRNNQAALSLRYERRIGWGKNSDNGDTVSGLARASAAVIPHTLTIEAGALAARTRVEGNGGAVLAPLGSADSISQLYSLYAGPSLKTRIGDFTMNGDYRIGYTRVNSPDAIALAPGQANLDVFDHSVTNTANLRIASRPGEALPVGVAAGAGYYQEDISNLDQRVKDFSAKVDVTVPVATDVALVGGVGYEDVTISSRDAVRDASGNPVIGSDGRYVTDKSAPRIDAYDVSGVIWDVGVMWRPSRRTSLDAEIGRRYGSTSFTGTFSYAPNSHSSFNVAVYDNVAGFGGQVNRALEALPTSFQAFRDPLTGDIGGCVASLQQGNCLEGALGSVRSSTFRDRGVTAAYNIDLGRIAAGIGAGYDRRKFIGAPGTVLAAANGVTDQNYWLAAYLNGRIDQVSGFGANLYANWFRSGFANSDDGTAIGASAYYDRLLARNLTATAAVGVDGITRQVLDDIWSASALVGVRYSFF